MGEIVIKQDSRRIFIDTLCDLAEKDDKIVLIVPDVGFLYIDKFKDMFPDRYYNTGVTEEFTMLMASGMALAGMKPYVYSMINFVLFRPYEMVRNGIVHHNANVKLLGVKGSTGYKFLGFSHNMTDDDEDKRTCDNLKLDCYRPALDDVRDTILGTYYNNKAAYIRL